MSEVGGAVAAPSPVPLPAPLTTFHTPPALVDTTSSRVRWVRWQGGASSIAREPVSYAWRSCILSILQFIVLARKRATPAGQQGGWKMEDETLSSPPGEMSLNNISRL